MSERDALALLRELMAAGHFYPSCIEMDGDGPIDLRDWEQRARAALATSTDEKRWAVYEEGITIQGVATSTDKGADPEGCTYTRCVTHGCDGRSPGCPNYSGSSDRAQAGAVQRAADVEQSRADFEAFIAWSRAGKGVARTTARLERDSGHGYADESTQRHWWTWQHARTALLAGAFSLDRLTSEVQTERPRPSPAASGNDTERST